MNPRKVLPDGARCGDYAVTAAGADDLGVVGADATIPEGTWI